MLFPTWWLSKERTFKALFMSLIYGLVSWTPKENEVAGESRGVRLRPTLKLTPDTTKEEASAVVDPFAMLTSTTASPVTARSNSVNEWNECFPPGKPCTNVYLLFFFFKGAALKYFPATFADLMQVFDIKELGFVYAFKFWIHLVNAFLSPKRQENKLLIVSQSMMFDCDFKKEGGICVDTCFVLRLVILQGNLSRKFLTSVWRCRKWTASIIWWRPSCLKTKVLSVIFVW